MKAYHFAVNHELNLSNVLQAHKMLTDNILIKKERGKIRTVKVGIRNRGRLIYLALETEFVEQELNRLFAEIILLMKAYLTIEEIFYFASFIYLIL
jgi:hypothetical protein